MIQLIEAIQEVDLNLCTDLLRVGANVSITDDVRDMLIIIYVSILYFTVVIICIKNGNSVLDHSRETNNEIIITLIEGITNHLY